MNIHEKMPRKYIFLVMDFKRFENTKGTQIFFFILRQMDGREGRNSGENMNMYEKLHRKPDIFHAIGFRKWEKKENTLNIHLVARNFLFLFS